MLPRALKLSYEIFRSAWIKRYPFLLYFKPTARCNLRCKSCSRWQDEGSSAEELSLQEIHSLLEKFRAAGFSILTLWGGEPTIRHDLAEIFITAKQLGYRTSMCTNCFLLPRKAQDILPHLDVLLCSVDGYGMTHDEFRGVSGLFDKVVEAITVAASFPHLYIKMWASIHKKNLGEIKQLCMLAQQLGVGIEFFPIAPIRGYNDEVVPDKDDLQKAFGEIRLLKQQGFPVRNPDHVLRMMQYGKGFQCNFARLAVFLDHKGDVATCEDAAGNPQYVWCNYKTFDPDRVFTSSEFNAVVTRMKDCSICTLPCMAELSGNLPAALVRMFFSKGRGVR